MVKGQFDRGAIFKRRLFKGGERGVEVKNVGIYLVKRRQRGREGGHKIRKMVRRRLWMAPYIKRTAPGVKAFATLILVMG